MCSFVYELARYCNDVLSCIVLLSPKKAYRNLCWISLNIIEVVVLILCVSQYGCICVLCIFYLIFVCIGKSTCMINHILGLRFLGLCNFLKESWVRPRLQRAHAAQVLKVSMLVGFCWHHSDEPWALTQTTMHDQDESQRIDRERLRER